MHFNFNTIVVKRTENVKITQVDQIKTNNIVIITYVVILYPYI